MKNINALLNIIQQKQKYFKMIQPAIKSKKIAYEKLITAMGENRGRSLWMPYIGSGHGYKSYVQLLDGSVKLDWITGIGVHFFGHSHRGIIKTAIQASLQDIIMQGNLQSNLEQHLFSECVLNYLKKRSVLRHIFISCTGSMANENAYKIVCQARFPASKLIAFKECFAGRTTLMASLTDNPKYREHIPYFNRFEYIPYYNSQDSQSTKKSLNTLRKIIQKNKNQIAAFIMEPLQGEGGFHTAPSSFFKILIRECHKHKILIWADEIQTFGRTLNLFASEGLGILKDIDILTFGKMAQCAGVLYKKEINPKPGLLSQTFTASTVSLAVGRYIIHQLLQGKFYGLQGRFKEIQNSFQKYFQALIQKHSEWIKDFTCIGTMVAFTVGDGSYDVTQKFLRKLFINGLIAFYCGHGPYRVRFLLPGGVITNREIKDGLKILEATFLEFEGEL